MMKQERTKIKNVLLVLGREEIGAGNYTIPSRHRHLLIGYIFYGLIRGKFI